MSSGGEHQSPPVEVSQSYHSSGLGQQPKPEGVDYSLQRQHDVYASMMQRSVPGHPPVSDRRSSHSYTGYEQSSLTGHPIGYNSNTSGTPVSSSVTSLKGGINPIPASASPPQSTWTPRHLQRVISPLIILLVNYLAH